MEPASRRRAAQAEGGCCLTKSIRKLNSSPSVFSLNPNKNEAGIASSLA
jgi:hypothetical protein